MTSLFLLLFRAKECSAACTKSTSPAVTNTSLTFEPHGLSSALKIAVQWAAPRQLVSKTIGRNMINKATGRLQASSALLDARSPVLHCNS
jgi:hypothetical protein